MRCHPLPWHRRYNWELLWPALRKVLAYALMIYLAFLCAHLLAQLDTGLTQLAKEKVYAAQEHQARESMLAGLRAVSRNGSLTETDVEEGTICMADLKRIK